MYNQMMPLAVPGNKEGVPVTVPLMPTPNGMLVLPPPSQLKNYMQAINDMANMSDADYMVWMQKLVSNLSIQST